MTTMTLDSTLLRPRGAARWIALALGLLLLAAGGFRLATAGSGALPADVAFRYDGHDVSIDQLDQRITTLAALYSIKVPTAGDQLDTFRRDAAKSMAVSMILADAAERDGVHVTNAQAQAGLDQVIASNLAGSQAKFTAFLGDHGISQQDVLDEIVRTLETTAVYEQTTASVATPTDAAVRADYQQHRAQLVSPERRTLQNIVVASRAAAASAIARLRAGQPFAAVASAVSLDRSTSGKGGALGSHAESDLDPAYAKVAFAARQGQVFGPVKSSTGWNVGLVDAITPSRRLSYAEVAKTLKAALLSSAKLKVWDDWLAKTIAAAGVQYADDYRPANPDAAPSMAPQGQDQP